MKTQNCILISALLSTCLAGCVTPNTVTTVYNADRVDAERLAGEGTIVFVRPSNYNIFGTESLRDYVEVVYEKAERNKAGLLKLDLGIRNRGGQWYYDAKGPDFQISVKTAFYDKPLLYGTPQMAPVYETNWQAVKLLRGATEHYNVICPLSSAGYYQVTLSELLK
jgi:hypothetical protein